MSSETMWLRRLEQKRAEILRLQEALTRASLIAEFAIETAEGMKKEFDRKKVLTDSASKKGNTQMKAKKKGPKKPKK